MEEVWIVYLCLILVVLVYFLMNRKPDDEIKDEKKDLKTAPVSSSYSAGSVGRHLECSEEELEQSFERLVGVFSKAEARKREAPHEHGASPQQREPSGRGPSQPQEKPSRPKSHESLVNEIEQAVQETVDAEAYVRRRQAQPASRSHREVQRPELSE